MGRNEVLIVGAGPVGLVAALKLVRMGVPVTVVEAEPDLVNIPKAVVYHPPSLHVLADVGVLDDVMAAGMPKYVTNVRSGAGEILLEMDMPAVIGEDTPYPFDVHLGQYHLGRIIIEHLLRHPTATLRWQTRLTDITERNGHVVATLSTPEGTEEVEPAWLLGTDGGQSGVRKALNLTFEGMTWPQRFIVTDVFTEFEPYGFAMSNMVLDPVDFAIIVKITKEGLWRVGVGEDPELDQATIADRLPARLGRLIPGPFELDRFSPYRVHNRVASRFRVGHVLLAGDAAHTCSPMGGLGLTGGIMDAAALADALGAVIMDGAPESVLDDYAADRRDIFLRYTSPTSADNTRRMTERDPARREQDRARLRAIQASRELQREALLATYRLVGRSFARLPQATAAASP